MEGLPSRIERVRALGFGGLAQTFSHSKRGGYRLSSEESDRGFEPSRAGRGTREEESAVLGPRVTGRRREVLCRGGVQPKGLFHERGGEEGTATSRKRLEKKSGDEREGRFDFGIEDEEPAFMRDEFASEPPSEEDELEGWELVGDLSGRDREMKELGIRLRGEFEDDQEGVRTMDDDNFIDDTLEWIRWPTQR
ncbi:hypothetical protein Syun_007584 [Stephania yunnanensis]|uniref:Uncharacterized protein n=1 Tax=Stephania yunnanensis TaxID=152371 RepID=A0AAP0PYV2_9MAGN